MATETHHTVNHTAKLLKKQQKHANVGWLQNNFLFLQHY
jgi:hypothetical protein